VGVFILVILLHRIEKRAHKRSDVADFRAQLNLCQQYAGSVQKPAFSSQLFAGQFIQSLESNRQPEFTSYSYKLGLTKSIGSDALGKDANGLIAVPPQSPRLYPNTHLSTGES